MSIRNKLSVTLLSLIIFPAILLSENVYTGKEANKIVSGAELVRISGQPESISYIRLPENGFNNEKNPYSWLKKVLSCRESDDFRMIKIEDDNLGFSHFRFNQFYNNVQVENGVYNVHFRDGKIHSANGHFFKGIDISMLPLISVENAFQKSKDFVNARSYYWQEMKINSLDFAKGNLVILYMDNAYHLVYKFDIYSIEPLDRSDVYVDAKSGKVLLKVRTIDFANSSGVAHSKYNGTVKITTDSISSTQFRLHETGRGNGIETYNLKQTLDYSKVVDFTDIDNIWTDTVKQDIVATDIHYGMEKTYDYFYTIHNRSSYDGLGSKIYNYVHAGSWIPLAFWDGIGFSFGDGDQDYYAFASLDIVAHEFSHAVIENSASLSSLYESGALQESFCDIFGVCVDFYRNPALGNYMIGEQVARSGQPMRNLASPKTKYHADTYNGQYWSNTLGDEYINAGVQNKWFFVLTAGDKGKNDNGDSFDVQGIGIQASQKIVYRSLTVYLTPLSDFSDARFYSIQSALDIYGSCSKQVIATTDAWHAVGVGSKYLSGSLKADFDANLTLLCKKPAKVQFVNKSTNSTNYLWDFGDSSTSTASNPSHVFSDTGYYTVSLLVWDTSSSCSVTDTDTIIKPNFIYVKPKPYIDFIADTNAGIAACNEITLFDKSDQCILNWEWTITPSYYQLLSSNPNSREIRIRFDSALYYTIKLKVDFGLSKDSLIKSNFIKISNSNKPAFTADNDHPRIGLDTITISDITGCSWNRKWVISPSSYTIVSSSFDKSQIRVVFKSIGCYDVKLEVNYGVNSNYTMNKCFIKTLNYCVPNVYNINTDLGISSFEFGKIKNYSSIGQAKYSDFTQNLSTTVSQYDTFSFLVARNTTFNEMNRKIWIDWNIDGDFFDAGEQVAYEASAKTLFWSGKIIIPGTSTIGKTILRIGTSSYNLSNLPCGPNTYGEFEDYRINVEPVIPLIAKVKDDDTIMIEQCTPAYTDSGYVIYRQFNTITKIDTLTNLNLGKTGQYWYKYSFIDNTGFKTEAKRVIFIVPRVNIEDEFALIGKAEDTISVFDTFVDPGYKMNIHCSLIKSVIVTNNINSSYLGTYYINYLLTSFDNRTTNVKRIVHVVDNENPLVSLLGYSAMTVAVYSPFTDPGIAVTDNYDPKPKVTITGKVFTSWVGTYELNYSVTDFSGNGPVVVKRVVNVIDTISPIVKSAIYKNKDTAYINVFNTFSSPQITTTDNYSASITEKKSGSFFVTMPDGYCDKVGCFTAYYTYSDSSENKTTFELTICVEDHIAPVITLIGPTAINLDSPKELTYDSFDVTDNYYSNLTVVRSGDYFTKYLVNHKLGVYSIYYNATDSSGNKAVQMLRVINVPKYSGLPETNQNELVLYPNPNNGKFVIVLPDYEGSVIDIQITNSLGKMVYKNQSTNEMTGKISFDLSSEISGLYFVRLISDSKIYICPVNLVN